MIASGRARPAAEGGAAEGGAPRAAEEVREALARLLGPAALGPTGDTLGIEGPVVVFPATEDEVAATLRRASEEGWGVLPAGSGTWLGAGPRPRRIDVVVSVRRLDRIVQYEPADLTLTAGAGLLLRGVARETAKEGQWLPLDPPGSEEGSLGATLSTASVGGLGAAYGGPRDLCLGLRLVTGDGRVLALGGNVVKNVAGFDLVKLAVGSWGTLGVITRATFRLFPTPAREVHLVARAERIEDLVGAARAAAASPVVPAAVELFEGPRGAGGGAGRQALLRVRVHGLPERAEAESRVLEAAMAREVERLEGGEGDPLSTELDRVGRDADMEIGLALPPAQLADLVRVARRAALEGGRGDPRTGSRVTIRADAARGRLHLAVGRVRVDPAGAAAVAERLGDLRAAVELRGGSLRLVRGPEEIVERVGSWGDMGAAARVMRELTAQFDPAGILSPGRFPFQGARG